MKTDIYRKVTDKIIADLEQGELTWLKPWNGANTEGRITKPLRHNGQPYNGINVLMLWWAAIEGGYTSPYWMTFKQAKELGAHVKKGERGNMVVYANAITKSEPLFAAFDRSPRRLAIWLAPRHASTSASNFSSGAAARRRCRYFGASSVNKRDFMYADKGIPPACSSSAARSSNVRRSENGASRFPYGVFFMVCSPAHEPPTLR